MPEAFGRGLPPLLGSRTAPREARLAGVAAQATAEIGDMTDREVLIAGAIAYWCEGTKNKPYRRANRVVFMNSDPGLIRFFLRFLEAAGVDRDDLILRVSIHEDADTAAAQQFWVEVTGASPSQFRRPTLKRHKPKTVRINVGETYHGCLPAIDTPLSLTTDADVIRRQTRGPFI